MVSTEFQMCPAGHTKKSQPPTEVGFLFVSIALSSFFRRCFAAFTKARLSVIESIIKTFLFSS